MFKPKRSGQELELNTAQFNIEKNKESKIYLDPQKQLSPKHLFSYKKRKKSENSFSYFLRFNF